MKTLHSGYPLPLQPVDHQRMLEQLFNTWYTYHAENIQNSLEYTLEHGGLLRMLCVWELDFKHALKGLNTTDFSVIDRLRETPAYQSVYSGVARKPLSF